MNTKRPTRELICRALLDLMEEAPFEEIPVTRIIQQAGVSRTSFYRNYESVYDVLQEIEDAYFERLPSESIAANRTLELTKRGKTEGPYASVEYADTIAANLRMYRILSGPNGDPSFEVRMKNRILRIYVDALKARVGERPELDLMAEYLTAAQMRAMQWWARHEHDVDPVVISSFISSMSAHAMQAIVEADLRQNIDIRATDA